MPLSQDTGLLLKCFLIYSIWYCKSRASGRLLGKVCDLFNKKAFIYVNQAFICDSYIDFKSSGLIHCGSQWYNLLKEKRSSWRHAENGENNALIYYDYSTVKCKNLCAADSQMLCALFK